MPLDGKSELAFSVFVHGANMGLVRRNCCRLVTQLFRRCASHVADGAARQPRAAAMQTSRG
jgi:hypothetical protein